MAMAAAVADLLIQPIVSATASSSEQLMAVAAVWTYGYSSEKQLFASETSVAPLIGKDEAARILFHIRRGFAVKVGAGAPWFFMAL